MRKFFTATATAGLLLGAMAMPVAAAGPACSQFISQNANGTPSSAAYYGEEDRVIGRFFLAGNACKQVTYTMYVLDNEGDSAPIAIASVTGDSSANEAFVIIEATDVVSADADVCVYITATIGKQKVTDRAPDDGCVPLPDDGSTPGGGKGF